jgi:hypothetical protein
MAWPGDVRARTGTARGIGRAWALPQARRASLARLGLQWQAR